MPRIFDKLKLGFGFNKQGKPVLPSQPRDRSGDEVSPSCAAQAPYIDALQDWNPDTTADPKPPLSCWDSALEKLKQEHNKTHEKLLQVCKGAQGTLSPESISASAKEEAQRLKELDWRLRNALKRVVKAIVSVEKVVMFAARLEPHGGAILACAGIFAVLQIALMDSKQYEFTLNSVVEIAPIMERWSLYEKQSLAYDEFSPVRTSKNLKDNLIDLYMHIMIHLQTMATYCQQSRLRRFTEAIAPMLDEWKSQLELVKTKDVVCKSHRDNHDMEKNFQKQNSDLLQWISTTDSSFEHQNVLDVTKVCSDYSQCGQWLLDSTEYCGWRDRQGSRVFWLRGTVGTGKTTLISRVIQNLKDFPTEQTRLAFHFCSKAQSGGERIDQVSVLRSIVRQMAYVPADTSIALPIVEIYERLKLDRPKEGNLSVENCVRLIKEIAQSAQKRYSASFRIIIDALDECEETGKLLKSLYEATETCDNVSMVFSSRLNVQVPKYLPTVIQIHTEAAASLDDMTFFVRNEIERRDERLPGMDPADLEDKLMNSLCGNANGMFRWTQMQLEDFFPSSATRPRLRTQAEVNDKLEKLSRRSGITNLDQEYERVYRENTTPGSESRKHAEKTFKLLLCCFKPLSLHELVVGASVEKDGSLHPEVCDSYILEICSNFIIVTPNAVQFAHPSAREYLESRKSDGVEEFAVEAQHIQVAQSCLLIVRHTCGELLEHVRVEPRRLRLSTLDYDETLRSLPVELHFPFYASHFWASHAAEISAAARETNSISRGIFHFLPLAAFRDWYILMLRTWTCLFYLQSNEIKSSLTDRDELSVPDQPNPIFLISAFGFVEFLGEPDIARRIPAHGTNWTRQTPLHVACCFGRTEIVENFLGRFREHFDVNAVDTRGYTPFQDALSSKANAVETVSLFLRHGVIAYSYTDIEEAFVIAIGFGRLEVVHVLIQHLEEAYTHQEILMLISQSRRNVLHTALRCDAICEFLLCKVGTDITSCGFKDKFGNSLGEGLLLAASTQGAFRSLQMLVKLKVPVNATDFGGCTALHYAKDCTIAAYLLREDSSMLWTTDAWQRTALHKAETCELAEYLFRQDSSLLLARDANGETPRLAAFHRMDVKRWQTLLKLGGNAQDRDDSGRTALHLVIRRWGFSRDYQPILELLIGQGLAGIGDDGGNTALHDAKYHSQPIYLLLLLEAGETLLGTNAYGITAAESVYKSFLDGHRYIWSGYFSGYHKIITYFMEEIRQEEETRTLGKEQRDILHFLCHQLRKITEYEDAQVEQMLRRGDEQRDVNLLKILTRQKECGWQLPMYKRDDSSYLNSK